MTVGKKHLGVVRIASPTSPERTESRDLEEKRWKLGNRAVELESSMSGRISQAVEELEIARTNARRAKREFDVRRRVLIELFNIIELGGEIVVQPVEGGSLDVLKAVSGGYGDHESSEQLVRTLTDGEQFRGRSMSCGYVEEGDGVILYASSSSGSGDSFWVRLTHGEDERPNYVITEVNLPEIILETFRTSKD